MESTSRASGTPARVPAALRVERAMARAMFRACRLAVRGIGFENIGRWGRRVGAARFWIGFVARRRMTRELAFLLGRPADDRQARQQMLEAFRSNDAAVLEILKMFDRPQDPAMLASRVEVHGIEQLDAALARGRGAILLATHSGNGALLPVKLAAAGVPLSVVYRESRMFPGGFFERGLSSYGVEGILATEGLKSYGSMLQALRRNRVVYVLTDQGTKKARDGIVFRFLGKDMPMPAGPAQLARHAGAPVLPVATVGACPRWQFRIDPPIEPVAGSTLEEDAERLLRVTEQHILQNPQWWSWHHRRWRHFPLATGEAAPRQALDRDPATPT